MFQNVLMTNLTPLRDTNEINCWDNRPFTTIWPELKNQERKKDTIMKKTIMKKNKRYRTTFTTDQVRELEKVFARSKYIDVEKRKEISEYLKMDQKCVKTWFQNRRMKEKKVLSESCDSASEGISESVSPPLEASLPANHEQDSLHVHPHVDHNPVVTFQNYRNETPTYHGSRPFQNYYNAPDNYLNEGDLRHASNNYEPSLSNLHSDMNFINSAFNVYRNDAVFSNQYYSPDAEFKYFYNMGFTNDQYTRSTMHDWPVNDFDTSYL